MTVSRRTWVRRPSLTCHLTVDTSVLAAEKQRECSSSDKGNSDRRRLYITPFGRCCVSVRSDETDRRVVWEKTARIGANTCRFGQSDRCCLSKFWSDSGASQNRRVWVSEMLSKEVVVKGLKVAHQRLPTERLPSSDRLVAATAFNRG